MSRICDNCSNYDKSEDKCKMIGVTRYLYSIPQSYANDRLDGSVKHCKEFHRL